MDVEFSFSSPVFAVPEAIVRPFKKSLFCLCSQQADLR